MTNIIRPLMEKVDNMQDQMDNLSREMKTPGKYQKKMLKSKNTSKMKNVFDGSSKY